MSAVEDIKLKGSTYLKKCVVHAIAMLHVNGLKEIETMRNFLDAACRETLLKLDRSTDEMETALNLSSNVGLNTFLHTLSLQNKQEWVVTLEMFSDAQYAFGETNEKIKQYEASLSDKYGKNIVSRENKAIGEIVLYENEKSLQTSISEIFSNITESKKGSADISKSIGITFVDKYEFLLQQMISESKKIKENLDTINFLRDTISIVFYIWRQYCNSDQKTMSSVLNNQYKDIENAILNSLS